MNLFSTVTRSPRADMIPDAPILPLAGPPAATWAAPAHRMEPTAAAGHILVVDDDAVMREFLGRMLRQVEYYVRCAEDGEAGWEVLRSDRVDVLITDHEMPRLTGLDLLRRVRAAPLAVPVILISGKMPEDDTDLRQLLPPGVALEKPFLFEELLARVRSFLTPTGWTGGNGDGPAWRDCDRNQRPPLGARAAG